MTKQANGKTGKALINSPDDIPEFGSEAEERAWWETHDLSEAYLRNYRLSPDDPVLKRLDELLGATRKAEP